MYRETTCRLFKPFENNSRQPSVTSWLTFFYYTAIFTKLKIDLPAYYKECLDAWSELNGKTPSCQKEIINEIKKKKKHEKTNKQKKKTFMTKYRYIEETW